MNKWFSNIATYTSNMVGSAGAFVLAFSVVLLWAMSGPLFKFSDTWQLVINTGTTIITFLMVFLIQHAQNSDTKALHLKLDEVIRSLDDADNKLIAIEKKNKEDL